MNENLVLGIVDALLKSPTFMEVFNRIVDYRVEEKLIQLGFAERIQEAGENEKS